MDTRIEPKFKVGQRVRIRDDFPPGGEGGPWRPGVEGVVIEVRSGAGAGHYWGREGNNPTRWLGFNPHNDPRAAHGYAVRFDDFAYKAPAEHGGVHSPNEAILEAGAPTATEVDEVIQSILKARPHE